MLVHDTEIYANIRFGELCGVAAAGDVELPLPLKGKYMLNDLEVSKVENLFIYYNNLLFFGLNRLMTSSFGRR